MACLGRWLEARPIPEPEVPAGGIALVDAGLAGRAARLDRCAREHTAKEHDGGAYIWIFKRPCAVKLKQRPKQKVFLRDESRAETPLKTPPRSLHLYNHN